MSPCQACGACCASFAVSFHESEVDDMPAGLTEPAGAPRRCVACRGKIGTAVACAIYEFRPGACRDFAPLAAVGRGDEACNDSRRRHQLPALGTAAA